jgi:hypothetical protein
MPLTGATEEEHVEKLPLLRQSLQSAGEYSAVLLYLGHQVKVSSENL